MAEDRNKREPLGGPYMIQDRDHLGDPGQMGGDSNASRQSDQSQSGGRQQGDQSGHGEKPNQKRRGKAK